MKAMKKRNTEPRRFALVFDDSVRVVGSRSHASRKQKVTTRTAVGPVTAYRKATGWKGKIGTSNGRMRQMPIMRVFAYDNFDIVNGEVVYKGGVAPPPYAYVVPIGEW